MKLLTFFYLLFFSVSLNGQSSAEEYAMKAAFIYNFTHFIEWEQFEGDAFLIGVFGESPIQQYLTVMAKTKTVNDKKIIIKQFKELSDIQFVNVLFIANSNPCKLEDILEKASAKGTLIVSEKAGYAVRGSAVNFIIVNKKLKFEINTKTMEKAGFKASSQLLKLAIIVD